MPEKKKPVMSFGPYPTDRSTSIESSVWANQIEVSGQPVTTYNVSVKRSYRDAQGNWAANQNFRPHDIPVLIHALGKAYDYCLEVKNASAE